MKRYSYEVHRAGQLWAVWARGPKGGTRWIATYKLEATAARVARHLNAAEGY